MPRIVMSHTNKAAVPRGTGRQRGAGEVRMNALESMTQSTQPSKRQASVRAWGAASMAVLQARQQGSAAAYAQQQQGSAVGCGGTSGSSIMCRPPCDGTKRHSSSKACECAAAGHSGGDRVMALHACHQLRHGCDSGGAVAAAWGARAIVCIGPVCDLESGCPDGTRFFFNFSKLHFCFRPIPGCVRRTSRATRCTPSS